MSETATRIPALCCECGTVRQVSRQAVRNGDRTRRLKCATCGTMTTHAAVFGRPETDWREHQNARESARREGQGEGQAGRVTGAPFALVAQVRIAIDDFRALGVRVEVTADAECDCDCGDDLLATLMQYLDDGQWWLTVYEDAPTDELLSALGKLWARLLDEQNTTWYVAQATDGEPACRWISYFGTRAKSSAS